MCAMEHDALTLLYYDIDLKLAFQTVDGECHFTSSSQDL